MFTVLIADDERMVRMNLRTMIERDSEGFRVVSEAKDGEQALQQCIEHKPDLVITDIRMPGIEGLELIRRLSEHRLNPEYLIISGHGDFQYAQSALRYGVADFMLKPIDPSYFLSALSNINTKIHSKSLKRRSSKEWIWTWKVHAEQTAKALWHLNHTSLDTELEWTRSMIRSNDSKAELELVEKLEYFLIVMEGALSELNSNGLPLPKIQLPENAATAEELLDSFANCLFDLIEYIRSSRNWWGYNRLLKGVQEYIEQHYNDSELSLKDTAEHFELSPNYFGNLFKKEAGMSFNQYLTQLRMEKAKAYLLDPMTRLYEVGEVVGYKDYAYFSKTFKKHIGFSPSEYRRYENIDDYESV
ncbi:response regulator transcription factor [Paenibacillus marinisediminis]